MGKPHTNNFTEEQMNQLRKNIYVISVTPKTIHFSEDFKRLFYQRKHSGETTRAIFRDCGIDPDILGRSRLKNFPYLLNKAAKRGEGFADKRQNNYRHPSQEGTQTVEARIRQLEHELAYTRQEVEFLKKLQKADMEARRQWESRHLPK